MGDMLKDERFAHVARDPKFRRIPKSERKVKIDKRFQSMFKDKKFAVKYTVDKRGRPVNQSTKENLRKYYDLPSEDESEDEKEKSETVESVKPTMKLKKKQKVGTERLKKKNEKFDVESEDHDENEDEVESEDEDGNKDEDKSESEDEFLKSSMIKTYPTTDEKAKDDKKIKKELKIQLKDEEKELSKDVKKKLRDSHVDYARGEGVLFSDSSSSEEENSEECDEIDDDIVHDWGEFDKDAETTDTITNRLAVCNMDWDRIRAVDLMVLFSSFLPKGSLINSVTIYPSEFGLQRMKEEEIKGPTELVQMKSENQKNCEEDEEGSSYHREKMRQYQLNRLKYYYAVVVCDSPESADKIYTECDGTEFELTGARIDLRFVPDDTTFDQEPREVCDKLPDVAKYKPRQFTTTALQQVKVDLTWDETDPNRVEIFEKLNAGKFDEVDDSELRNYLASGSSSEEEPDNENKTADEPKPKKMSTIEKYKSLLRSIEEEEEEKKRNKNMELEVSWNMDAKEKAEQLVKESTKKSDEMTPFEKFVEKKKEKKKAKREEKKKLREQQRDERGDSDVPSDVDMDDPYFAEEIQAMKKFSKKRKASEDEGEDSEEKRNKAELELLLMDKHEDTKKHFNMKKIEEIESMSKSKKKRLEKKKKKIDVADGFEVDTEDPRFAALYSSHHFNIDPSDPHYRKTKGTDALIQQKMKIRDNDHENQSTKLKNVNKSDKKDIKNAELSALVKSVKRKASGMKK